MTGLASTSAYTVAGLHAMPDDGRAACPPELYVLAAPFPVTVSPARPTTASDDPEPGLRRGAALLSP